MTRVASVLLSMLALLVFAPAVGAASPHENFDSVGFDAFNSQCGQQTCTDTSIFAEEQTTSSGETFLFVCADQFTFNIRNGHGTGRSGCTEAADVTVAGDLSSASLAPTEIDVCQRNNCSTITVSAELDTTGASSSFRSRFSERDGTCTFTFSENGQSRQASGTITFDGTTLDADGSIRSVRTTVTSRCR
jgi:hypothetical protein